MTRPITDRVKQSLFDRLSSMGALECDVVLDIFAGTGSLGLEALSRGVEHCVFIETHRPARQRLMQNLQSLDLTDRATVLAADALHTGWVTTLARKPVGLICLDPPYELSENESTRARLATLTDALATIASADAVMTLRTPRKTPAIPSEHWDEPAIHLYGSMALHFYPLPDGS